ncbi:MAG: hypothetical protein L3K19_09690 [Thermoplasmata archaeon]|nr:hypothetical protein [Thermoplasmata archaeon]
MVRDLIDALMGKERELEFVRKHGEKIRTEAFRTLHRLTVERERTAADVATKGRAAVEAEVAQLRVDYEPYAARGLPLAARREWIHERKQWFRLLRSQHDLDLLRLLEATP